MPTIKTISSAWPKALREQETRNWAAGKSDTFATLAGRNRWLNEFLRGEFATDRSGSMESEAPGVPPNPQGMSGLDHSGPPYGSALRHTVAHYNSIKYGTTDPLNDYRTIDVPVAGESVTFPIPFYNKPFAPHSTAPHSRGNFHVRIYNRSGTAGAVTFRIRSAGDTTTLTTASCANNTTQSSFFNAANDRFNISSGLNVIHMEISRDNLSPTDFWVLAWDIGIIGKTGLVAI